MQELIETWEISNRINLYLLDTIAEEHLTCVASTKGRSVGEQWAHLHNVRLLWLKEGLPDLFEKLQKVEKEHITKAILVENLTQSSQAIGELIKKGVEVGKIKGFKPHPTAFMGYLIAHEAHHRSQIVLILKQNGHPVDKKTSFGLWEWGVR